MFSGYLTTNSTPSGASNGSIHYMFLESLGNASSDPVILWLNGGPGCSSLFGLFKEIGPQLIMGANIVENPYTWLKNASILVFESPFGVGYSYNTTEISYSETETALYNYNALLNWFQTFSNYKNSSFWITGESYAGMFIPYLSSLIVNNTKTNQILFKGIMIGNGVLITDPSFNNNQLSTFFGNHNLYSPQIQHVLQNVCPNDPLSASCVFAQREAQAILTKVNLFGNFTYF